MRLFIICITYFHVSPFLNRPYSICVCSFWFIRLWLVLIPIGHILPIIFLSQVLSKIMRWTSNHLHHRFWLILHLNFINIRIATTCCIIRLFTCRKDVSLTICKMVMLQILQIRSRFTFKLFQAITVWYILIDK